MTPPMWLVEFWAGPLDGGQDYVSEQVEGSPPVVLAFTFIDGGIYRLREEWNDMLPIYDWIPSAPTSVASPQDS